MASDPDVGDAVDGWVHGWCASRGTPAPQWRDGAWRVATGTAEEPVRLVVPRPDLPTLRAVLRQERPPGTVLKLPGDPATWTRHLPAGSEVLTDDSFMTLTSLTTDPAPDVPAVYVVERRRPTPGLAEVVVRTTSGERAARGQVGLGPSWGVPDRVVTQAAHRRRGLGALVMHHLGAAAADAGVGRLVLGATVDGRLLYESLGWQRLAPMASYRLA